MSTPTRTSGFVLKQIKPSDLPSGYIICPRCSGSGTAAMGAKCMKCDGKGYVRS